MMFKNFFIQKCAPRPRGCASWADDPLGHPDIMKMDLRQLADLPLTPEVSQPVRGASSVAKAPYALKAISWQNVLRQRHNS